MLLAASMRTVGPDYPVHLAYFCASCGIGQTADFYTSNNLRVLDSGDFFKPVCIMDNILMLMSGVNQEFKSAFISSVVDHLLLILTFQMDRSSDIKNEELRVISANKNFYHNAGYFILLEDCALELAFFVRLESTDPGVVRNSRKYSSYNTDEITEIADIVTYLRTIGYFFGVLRSVTAALVLLCNHLSLSHDFPEDGEVNFTGIQKIGVEDNDHDHDQDEDVHGKTNGNGNGNGKTNGNGNGYGY